MNNKKILLAPLIGGITSVFIFIIYLMITVDYQNNSIINIVFSLLSLMPLMIIIFSLISYTVCFFVGVPLVYLKNKYFLSYNIFWLLSLIIFLTLGCIIGVVNYKIEQNIAKSIALFLSFTFGGLFSASLYSVLNEDVKIK